MKTTTDHKENNTNAANEHYNDPGRFDVCRSCPLKVALIALKASPRDKH